MSGERITVREWRGRSVGIAVAGAAVTGALLAAGHPFAVSLPAALAAACLLAPVAGALAARAGAIAAPGGRGVHERPTALWGGFAVLVPVLPGAAAFDGARGAALAVAGAALAAGGAYDDLRRISPRAKLALEVVAAGILFAGGFRVASVSLPPIGVLPTGALELPILVFWVVLVTNAVNLVDGLDGLASGVGLVAVLGALALGSNDATSVLLAGALLGFLRHNLPKATLFLGDAGSLPLGLALATLPIRGDSLHVPLAAGLLALPLGDVVAVVLRRALRGKPLFAADRAHAHHRLLAAWGDPKRALGALLAFAAICAAVVTVRPDVVGLAAVAAASALGGAFLLRTSGSRFRLVVRNRAEFARLHVVGRCARESLRLARDVREIHRILERFAEDLDLLGVHVGGLHVACPAPDTAERVLEVVPCARSLASCVYVRNGHEPRWQEERSAVVADVVRDAEERLARIDALAAGGGLLSVPQRPRVHFVAENDRDLARLAPALEKVRAERRCEPVLVNVRRADSTRAGRLVEPRIDLDVPEGAKAEVAGMRYAELLDVVQPMLVVVSGASQAGRACAAAARVRGVPVASLELSAPRSTFMEVVHA